MTITLAKTLVYFSKGYNNLLHLSKKPSLLAMFQVYSKQFLSIRIESSFNTTCA